jgi:hypothetical protein
MALHTHLVVTYNHDTNTFTFDGDGTREWIRRLFEPETNTWSDEAEDFIPISKLKEDKALRALQRLGVTVEEHDWKVR